MEEFKRLGLSDSAIDALRRKGISRPTLIQSKVIPLLLEGKKDIVGQSQTGTGKTAGFALPIIRKIDINSKDVQAIILTPTRELALQVAKEINSLKGDKDIKVLAVYGGDSINHQRQKLKYGIDIVVGTPGRVIDLQNRKALRLENIKYAVLDEADEMLNMGFVEDIKIILKNTPKDKNMLLFSATMPKPILKIAEKYMREYEFIKVEQAQIITKNVEQVYYDINAKDRVEGIRRILDFHTDFHGIIFCNTRLAVDSLTSHLTKMHYKVAALHGDFAQSQREKILQQFRDKAIKILVATDVAARGIDVNDLTHVINYSLPQSPQLYVHRIGRTGRAGKKGIAITFVIPSERSKLNLVERVNKCSLKKQRLPSAREIVETKEVRIKSLMKTIIEADKGKGSKYFMMAENLLKEYDPLKVVSAVLKYAFKNELGLNSYKEISEPSLKGPAPNLSKCNFRQGRTKFRRNRKRSKNKNYKNKFEKKTNSDFRKNKRRR